MFYPFKWLIRLIAGSNDSKETIKKLQNELKELEHKYKELLTSKLPERKNVEEILEQKEFEEKCLEQEICHICGKDLISVNDDDVMYDLKCPEHGIIYRNCVY